MTYTSKSGGGGVSKRDLKLCDLFYELRKLKLSHYTPRRRLGGEEV
jgi:hypothetical protein